jgi:hypothetical protein
MRRPQPASTTADAGRPARRPTWRASRPDGLRIVSGYDPAGANRVNRNR